MAEPAVVAEGRLRAAALRFDHKLGDAPIRDLFGFIERHLDVLLVRYPMPEGPEGALLRAGRRRLIILNTHTNYLARQRFTAAHEVAHLEFDLDRDPVYVDKAVYGSTDPAEVRANAFAIHFLLPADELRARSNDPDFDLTSDTDLVGLAMEYGVSLSSLSWHLKNVCGISEKQRRWVAGIRVFQVATRMGLTDRVERERRARGAYGWPSAYVSLAMRGYERGLLDKDYLEAALADPKLVQQLTDALADTGAQ